MISFLMTKTLSSVQNVSKQAKAAQAAGHCKLWGGGGSSSQVQSQTDLTKVGNKIFHSLI